MQSHEYSLLGGINRSQIGRYLGSIAALISGGIVFLVLSVVDITKSYNLPINLPPAAFSLAGAGTVFAALYWLFDRYIWRWSKIRNLLKVPDLSGIWVCNGRSMNPDKSVKNEWVGTVNVVQSWDRIRVRLKTTQSGSNSIAAALLYDEIDGFQLIYNYRNEPRIEETVLNSHLGFSNMTFAKDQMSAEGEYFNGHGRFTFGTMSWARE